MRASRGGIEMSAPTLFRWIAASALAGLLVGALTLVGQAVLPLEANRLANSGAIWVTVAFLIGWRTPSDVSAAAAGLLTLVAALAGYFVAAAIAQAGVSASTVTIWVAVALVGGPVFGLAGRWRGSDTGWRSVIAVALLSAVYVAEGAWTLLAIPHMVLAGWASVVAGVVLALVLSRDRRSRLMACALVVPLALLGLLGYAAIDTAFRAA